MQLSVIILNYNVKHFLVQCIASVFAATKTIDAEIIVVDNASTDGSMDLIRDLFPSIKCIQNDQNIGFSKAYNFAVGHAQGDYLCILNPDTLVGEHIFSEVLSCAARTHNLGAIGVRYIDGAGIFLPECKRQVPSPLGTFNKLMGRLNATPGYYDHALTPAAQGPTDILAGAFMVLKKAAYLDVGGFDETYFMYGEDIDLSYKFIKRGYVNYYLGTSVILHYKGESTDMNAAYLKRFYGAMVHFYKTHHKTNVFSILGVKIFSQLIIYWRSLKLTEILTDDFIWQATVLVTTQHDLEGRLKRWSKAPVRVMAPDYFSEEAVLKNTMVVFDADSCAYCDIIQWMARSENSGLRYRVVHPEVGCLIGSDQSTAKGEVVAL